MTRFDLFIEIKYLQYGKCVDRPVQYYSQKNFHADGIIFEG